MLKNIAIHNIQKGHKPQQKEKQTGPSKLQQSVNGQLTAPIGRSG